MDIKSATYLISNVRVDACPTPDMPEFAFIGRSNVGKSSLINMLTSSTKLAKVSSNPGKTQTINHFIINKNWYLVDLPGYGYAKVSQTQRAAWQKMIANYLQKRENLVTVFVLIDVRLKPQKNDLDFLAQLGEWKVPFNIVFTKADKITQREASKNAKQFIETMRQEWQFIPRSFITSTVKHLGKKELLGYLDEMIFDWHNPEAEEH
ncbi:MAG: YihA family ribosome biogenesis GTP-binding protein [Bacteroidota bacterium]|jgi:GTP-binding protein|nr:YihA family ribosome biogenesis GTP-binding protein [Bacteroidota bacterium]